MDPELNNDPTYLWGSKWIDYILIFHTLAELVVKAGHHHFNEHFISDHKGIYIQFKEVDIFDIATMDRSYASYRRMRMSRRDIVRIYISHLEALYKEHSIWKMGEKLARRVITASSTPLQDKYFLKFDKLDQQRIWYMRAAENFAGSSLLMVSMNGHLYWRLLDG